MTKSLRDFQDGGRDVHPPLAAADSTSVRRLPASPPSACLRYRIHGTLVLAYIIDVKTFFKHFFLNF